MLYVPPTDNWHIYCSEITPVYTMVDGRGHGLACLNFSTVFWADLAVFGADMSWAGLAVFGADMSGKTTDIHAPCATNRQLAQLLLAESHPCTHSWMEEDMAWLA